MTHTNSVLSRARRAVGDNVARLRHANLFRSAASASDGQLKIFVIGTGRSGTHLLGRILEAHPDIHATIEQPRIFEAVTRMALDADREDHDYARLVRLYKREHGRAAGRHYVDKSHPSIWFAERLAETFPEAVFLGIQRNPYGTVASMLNHEGVRTWHRRWREFPVPNRFLGITEEVAESYDELHLAAKCAVRWRAHAIRMAELRQRLGDRIWVVEYERLLTDTHRVLEDLQRFLGLVRPLPMPAIKGESLDKWRSQLSEADVAAIASVIGHGPPVS